MNNLNNNGRPPSVQRYPPSVQRHSLLGPLEATGLAKQAVSNIGLGAVSAYMNPSKDTLQMLDPIYHTGFGLRCESHVPDLTQFLPQRSWMVMASIPKVHPMAPLGCPNHPSVPPPPPNVMFPSA